MRRPVLVALGVFLVQVPALALDPARRPSQYVITRWGAGALGSNTVQALLQSRDGDLWIGTGAGLLRHDGTRFVAYGPEHAAALGGGVSSLAEAAGGSLYFGTSTGVLEYRAGTFTALPLDVMGPVRALCAARDGTLWIGQMGRPLATWRPGAGARYLTDEVTLSPVTLAEGAPGRLLVGTGEGLLRLAEETRLARDDITRDIVQSLLPAADGTLWIGTRHGLLEVRAGSVRRHTTRDGLPHDSITALAVDREGSLWLGTPRGLSRRHAGVFESLSAREGLPDDDIHALLADRDGNLWIGTGDGLACLSDGRFVTYGRHEGLPDAVVTAVTAARGGGAWLGTDSAQIVRLKPNGALTTYALPAGEGPEAVTALLETREGELWSVLATGRVFRLRGGVVSDATPALGKSARERTAGFFEDDEGVGLLVARRGLTRIRDGQPISLLANGPLLQWPHMTHRDARGVLWMGTSVGLAEVRGGAYRLYGAAEGPARSRVRWIQEDPDGTLWLATAGGLARFANGRFETLGVAQGLPEDVLRVVLDDGLGYFWIAGLGSLFRLDKTEVREVLAGQRPRVTPLVFDTSDGLRTTEARLTNSPAFRADDGRLWFATTKGVSVVDPRHVLLERPAPEVTIESLTVDRRAGDRQGAPVFGPGRGEVAIEYAARGFVSPHKIRFRHRLHGLDADWVEAGPRRQAYYGALAPASYRFEVMASNPDGRWNGTPAAVAFSIRPPFVRTPTFYFLCAAVLGVVLLLAHRLRMRQVRARFDVVLAERTRIAREMHDTLAQGVAGVGLQIETVLKILEREPASARAYLRQAHAMARSSLEEVRRSIWVLRAQATRASGDLGETLRRSLGALAAGQPTVITVEVHGTPRPLDAAVERCVLRIAHEAVGNALRHAEAATVAVDLDLTADALVLSVRDDGRGFDLDRERALQGSERFGLLGIEERVRVLGGRMQIETAAGAGTRIVCRLPYAAPVQGAESVAEDGP